jgi:hypothetical protein
LHSTLIAKREHNKCISSTTQATYKYKKIRTRLAPSNQAFKKTYRNLWILKAGPADATFPLWNERTDGCQLS